MKKIQHLFVYFSIGLIFLGSIGVGVFSHLCSINGTETSFFKPIEDKCKQQVEVKSCCHKPEKLATSNNLLKFEKEKCCSESFSYYKISTENADKILKLKFSPNHLKDYLIFQEVFPVVFDKEIQIALKKPDPPCKSGREILIAFQVFRI